MINNHSHSGLGGDGEKIDYNNLKNLPVSSGGGLPVVAFVTIPITTTTGSLDITSTDITFTPRFIRIQAQLDAESSSSNASWSDMSSDGTNSGGLFLSGGQADYSTSRMIRLYDIGTTEFGANFTGFISGGVEVDVTHADFGGSDAVNCIITAYE